MTKFKVGDKVRLISDSKFFYVEKGGEYEVAGFDGRDRMSLKNVACENTTYIEDHFELVERHKFKVGDKVNFIGDRVSERFKKDVEYEIFKIEYNRELQKYLLAFKGIYSNRAMFFEGNFELVPQSKFKVGDKVRVMDDTYYGFIRNKEIHEVIKVNNNRIALKGIGQEICMYCEENFELVKTQKIMYCVTTYLQTIRTNAKNFTVGKQYEIIDEFPNYYKVKNDEGTVLCAVPKYLFSEEKPVEKRCNNCKYSQLYDSGFPCKRCYCYAYFVPKQPTSKTKHQEFKELTQPISDWLYKNGSPHDSVIITQGSAEHLSGEMAVNFELKD